MMVVEGSAGKGKIRSGSGRGQVLGGDDNMQCWQKWQWCGHPSNI